MQKKLKKIPKFKTEDEERKFWDTHSSVGYIDWSKPGQAVFPNLRMTSRPISIRLSESIITKVKLKANRLNVPYQSLIKQYIAAGLDWQPDIVKETGKNSYGKNRKS